MGNLGRPLLVFYEFQYRLSRGKCLADNDQPVFDSKHYYWTCCPRGCGSTAKSTGSVLKWITEDDHYHGLDYTNAARRLLSGPIKRMAIQSRDPVAKVIARLKDSYPTLMADAAYSPIALGKRFGIPEGRPKKVHEARGS